MGQALASVAERLRIELQLSLVVIEVEPADGLPSRHRWRSRRSHWPIPRQGRARRDGEEAAGTISLVRRSGGRGFRGVDNRLLSAVSTQLGLAVERERLRRESMDAEVLRRTNELKSALIDAVSHDLRTPLASIIASAGSLRQQDVVWTEEDRQEFAEAIEQEARRLNRIVGNLLDLSRIQGGSLRPVADWYDLADSSTTSSVDFSHLPRDIGSLSTFRRTSPCAPRLRGNRSGPDKPGRERRQPYSHRAVTSRYQSVAATTKSRSV